MQLVAKSVAHTLLLQRKQECCRLAKPLAQRCYVYEIKVYYACMAQRPIRARDDGPRENSSWNAGFPTNALRDEWPGESSLDNKNEGMAGTTGLEPATSAVTA